MRSNDPPTNRLQRTTLDELDDDAQRTRVLEGEPRTVRLALDTGERVPPHRHPDREIVLFLLEGRLSITLDGEEHEVEAGELVRFDGSREVSPAALEPSTALLILARSPETDDEGVPAT